MSSVSDHVQLMKSQETKYDSVFNKRKWLYIDDTTTQYDQGTSIIETTSLSNNSKFLDYNSAYLSVPLLVTLTSNASAIAGTAGTKSPAVQYSLKATIMLKDIHPLFEVMPISKSLNFKIQIFWNNSVVTATHDGTKFTAQSSQYRAYNGTSSPNA